MMLPLTGLAVEGPLRVGLFKDARSGELEGIQKTLKSEGMDASIIEYKDLTEERLKELDVIYFSAGWNAIQYLLFDKRRLVTDFVAQGKGVLLGGFRSGWFRSSNRPLFPQVGYTYCKNNQMFLFPKGDGPLTEGFDRPYKVSSWDQMWVKVGPLGKVFAVNSDGVPIGAYGDVYGGRCVALGCFFAYENKTELEGTERKVFMNCVRWLGQAGMLPEAERARNRAGAELDFLRRERGWDWLLDEQGPDNRLGALPQLRSDLEMSLYGTECRLRYAVAHLDGSGRVQAEQALDRLLKLKDRMLTRYAGIAKRKTKEIETASRAELAADNPFLDAEAVLRKVKEAPGKNAEAKAELVKALSGKQPQEQRLRDVLLFLYGDKILTELRGDDDFEAERVAAEQTLKELAPQVAAAKERAAKLEREKDVATVPGLIGKCADAKVSVRVEAATELGRIGDPSGVPALLKLMDDADLEVRVRAIQSLGWLQAKDAVPGLLKALESDSPRIKRRAAQSLGQIGDERAAKALLAHIKDPDYHTALNAILSLGWLGSKDAVEPLLEIIESGDRNKPYQREPMIAAVRSLGHIGDKRAVPALERLAKEAKDFPPGPRGRPGRHTNYLAIGTSLGLQGHAELALPEIAQGGRAVKGLPQPEFLSSKDKFHGLKKNFNFLAGRVDEIGNRFFNNDTDGLFAAIWSIGGTGVHCAWDISRFQYAPDAYRDRLRKAGEYDLRWIDTMPTTVSDIWHWPKPQNYIYSANGGLLEKSGAEVTLLAYQDVPAFQGFWCEEIWPDVSPEDERVVKGFEPFLVTKYGPDFRKKLGLLPDTAVTPPKDERSRIVNNAEFLKKRAESAKTLTAAEQSETTVLWAEFLEYAGDTLIDEWREAQEWLHGVRKGCSFTYNETNAVNSLYIGTYGKAGGIIDAFGPEDYMGFAPMSTLLMELAKDGEPRAVMSEFYNWFDPSIRDSRICYAKQLMHGECFFNFDLGQIFPSPGSYLFTWDKARWDAAAETFQKARKIKDYLAGAESGANVALVASERTMDLFYWDGQNPLCPSYRYNQQLTAFWVLLQQAGVPADAIWAETMTPAKLARYKLLLLPDAKALTPGEEELLRQWVKQGGVLLTTGGASLFDQSGRVKQNYGLADVMGVVYKGHGCETGPDASDTVCFVPGEPKEFKVTQEGLDPILFRRVVFREYKPERSVGAFQIVKVGPELPGLAAGTKVEYDMPLGYDKEALTSATALGTWPDGTPALTVNKFGEGLNYHIAATYPALAHQSLNLVYTPGSYDFWPGVRELFEAAISGGLKARGTSLPAEVVSGSKGAVEITVRRQPDKNRWMVHLINCDTKLETVKGLRLILRPPVSERLKIHYPDTGMPIEGTQRDGGVSVEVRDFAVHDMIAVEY